jgi:hypothetical protein
MTNGSLTVQLDESTQTVSLARARNAIAKFHDRFEDNCWRIKLVSTYNPQAYGPTPFSPRDSLGSCQSAEQGNYKRLIYLYLLTYPNPNLQLN